MSVYHQITIQASNLPENGKHPIQSPLDVPTASTESHPRAKVTKAPALVLAHTAIVATLTCRPTLSHLIKIRALLRSVPPRFFLSIQPVLAHLDYQRTRITLWPQPKPVGLQMVLPRIAMSTRQRNNTYARWKPQPVQTARWQNPISPPKTTEQEVVHWKLKTVRVTRRMTKPLMTTPAPDLLPAFKPTNNHMHPDVVRAPINSSLTLDPIPEFVKSSKLLRLLGNSIKLPFRPPGHVNYRCHRNHQYPSLQSKSWTSPRFRPCPPQGSEPLLAKAFCVISQPFLGTRPAFIGSWPWACSSWR